jgi:hypothetical protein
MSLLTSVVLARIDVDLQYLVLKPIFLRCPDINSKRCVHPLKLVVAYLDICRKLPIKIQLITSLIIML